MYLESANFVLGFICAGNILYHISKILGKANVLLTRTETRK